MRNIVFELKSAPKLGGSKKQKETATKLAGTDIEDAYLVSKASSMVFWSDGN